MSGLRKLSLVAGVVLMLSPPQVIAQMSEEDSSSHRLLDLLEGQTADFQARLAEKFAQTKQLQQLAQKILNDPAYQDEIEKLKQRLLEQGGNPQLDPNDPALQALARKLLEQQFGLSNLPPAGEPLQLRPLPKSEPVVGSSSSLPPQFDADSSKSNAASDSRAEPAPPAVERSPSSGPTIMLAPQASASQGLPANNKFLERVLRLTERLKALDPVIRQSPALNEAFRDLGRQAGAAEPDERWLAFLRKLGDWSDYLPQGKTSSQSGGQASSAWAERMARAVSNISWLSWPALDRLTQPSSEQHSSSEALAGVQGLKAFSWLVIVLVLAIFIWRLLRARRVHALLAPPAAWKLGPWPVRPENVRTRDDLVRAFEYLALLKLGPKARHWNHRTIADKLEQVQAKDGQVANELATVYEQARYAPPTDWLSEATLAAARRHLSSLAGVTGA